MNSPFASVADLEEALSRPSAEVVRCLGELPGDLLVLGVGGKMGPSLARMARRASDQAGVTRRVIGVSRFRTPGLREQLEQWGIETVSCDLMEEVAVADLPDAANVMFMTGFKFGASAAPAQTWATNCYLPAIVSRRFSQSRIAAFSSGNVYGMTPVDGGGSVESDTPRPVGEYAMTTLGRERMFEYFAERFGFPLAVLRLNYAHELRYGVLVDIAQQILAGHPIDLGMGYVNVLWQADANRQAWLALADATNPPLVINLAGPEVLSIRRVAEQLGELLGRGVAFTGEEQADALLSNSGAARARYGSPEVTATELTSWVAAWLADGQPTLGKPTHFESRSGKF